MPELKLYRVRYLVEPWNKPRPRDDEEIKVRDGIILLKDSKFGYTDELFIVSMLDGGSYALFSTDGHIPPTKESLLKVKGYIEHYLEHGHFS